MKKNINDFQKALLTSTKFISNETFDDKQQIPGKSNQPEKPISANDNQVDIKTKNKINKEKKADVLLQKELSINNAEEIKKKLMSALNKHKNINVTLKNIENLDLAGIQLLYSCSRTCRKLNKKVTFNIELPEDIETIVENSGFSVQNL